MTSTMLTMYRVDWRLPKKRGKEVAGPRVLEIASRYITLRERRSSWDCLPLDTYEDLAHAAREGWYPTPEAALEGSLAYYRAEKKHAQRRIALVQAEQARRAKGRAK